jgi:hypothetical protein
VELFYVFMLCGMVARCRWILSGGVIINHKLQESEMWKIIRFRVISEAADILLATRSRTSRIECSEYLD